MNALLGKSRLHCLLEKVWFDNRPQNWQDLLRLLPGFYPLQVKEALELIGVGAADLGTGSPPNCRGRFPEAVPGAVEHPLDFEWRFTEESLSTILAVVREYLPWIHSSSIACLGSPSVAVAGVAESPSTKWSLFDRRAGLLAATHSNIELIPCDLSGNCASDRSYDAVLVDPPWYEAITKQFLENAINLVRKRKGFVFLSFPPEGTRPSALSELVEIERWCGAHGLILERSYPDVVYYKTPFFEYNSLRAAEFMARVPAWRKGVFLVFRSVGTVPGSPEVCGCHSAPHDEWVHFTFSGLKVCIKVRESPAATSGASLESEFQPIVTGEVLPSVSTKFPGRDAANIVTSGNRSFGVKIQGWLD